MSLLSRLRESFATPTIDRLSGLREATVEDWFWNRASTQSSEEDYFWRRLADNWTLKDVLPSTYLEIHNQCFEAYNANPMANAIIEMGVNFVLGDGLQIDCRSKKVQKLIDAFWHDPDNRMDQRQFDLVTELSLYGEIFVRIFVNPFNGHVKLAQLDPSLVDQIECDPENVEKQLRVHRRPLATGSATDMRGIGQPNLQDPGALMASDPRYTEGQWFSIPDEILHFAINKVTNAKRGKSDLATLLPWLRRYKDWLIDRVRINKYKAAFLWDVTLTGADRRTIENKLMDYSRPPEPGSVLVHNESEAWSAVQPHIDASSVAPDGQAIKMMVAMGAGLPEHYLSEGGDVNRATAAEMGLPTIKRYQRRQDYVKWMLSQLLDRVISEAQKAGTLPRTTDTHYEIRFPELDIEDAATIGIGSWHMAQALHIASSLGMVSRETAVRLFLRSTREEIDLLSELQKIATDPLAPPNPASPSPPPAEPAHSSSHAPGRRGTSPHDTPQPTPLHKASS